eukprot:TRINITY_DN3382_c0_g1_i2.p1 TRINITY_DN3382_c0_g1~~TRINITY_DN3382_c0_g1_i2.p1  ORF type:complete len:457 (-),score=87.95 TRINITY_DN3382_c0_g1_i2:34-1404(-)
MEREKGNNVNLDGLNLPPLGMGSGLKSSSPHGTKPEADLKEKPFKHAKLRFRRSRFFLYEFAELKQLDWTSEFNIQVYVERCLTDLVQAMNLPEQLVLKSQMSLVSIRPDIWFVEVGRRPVGVVEVKVPVSSILEKPSVHGQIYDYLMALREYFGIKDPFGIVTTYEEWRVCWLPASTNIAITEPPPNAPKISASLDLSGDDVQLLATAQPIKSSKIKVKEGKKSAETETREVHGSRIYKFDDKQIFHVLGSAIIKMLQSDRKQVNLFSKDQAYILTTKTGFVWSHLPDAITPRFTEANLKINSSKFYLIRDLGSGVSGKVWLAMTKSGEVGALKLCTATDAKREEKIWNRYQPEFKVKFLSSVAGGGGLFMPYLAPVQESEMKGLHPEIKLAIEKFLEAGHVHTDMKPEHLGKYRHKDGTVKVSLLDFGNVAESNPKTHDQDLSKMFQKLEISHK